MTHEDDRFPDALRKAAREYNNPPELTRSELDEMWSSIEAESFGRKGFASPQRGENVERWTSHVERRTLVLGSHPVAARSGVAPGCRARALQRASRACVAGGRQPRSLG
jgi:hypothetical protein